MDRQSNVTMLLQVIGRLCDLMDAASRANNPNHDSVFAQYTYNHAVDLLWEIVGDNSIEFLEYDDARS